MQIVQDNILLGRLKSEDNASFRVLYKFYFPPVAAYICSNFGNTEDAEDVFQESIIVLLQKVRNKDFKLTSSLKTYLFAIAKNIWLKRLRDNKLVPVNDFEPYQKDVTTFSVELHPIATEEEKLSSWLTKITENCQRVLKAIFYDKIPMSRLIQIMGWKNKHTAANQQYKCLQQVKKEKNKNPVS